MKRFTSVTIQYDMYFDMISIQCMQVAEQEMLELINFQFFFSSKQKSLETIKMIKVCPFLFMPDALVHTVVPLLPD